MDSTRKFTPCRETYIVLCTIIPIWPILIGIVGVCKSEPDSIWIVILGIVLIFVIAFVISRYYLIVDDISISSFSIFKKTTILRSDVTKTKYDWETGCKGTSPVFYIYTKGSKNPSMKIRIKNFSNDDVREIAKLLNIKNY